MEGFRRFFKYYCSKCQYVDDREFDANNYSTNCPKCKVPMSYNEIQDDIQIVTPEVKKNIDLAVDVSKIGATKGGSA